MGGEATQRRSIPHPGETTVAGEAARVHGRSSREGGAAEDGTALDLRQVGYLRDVAQFPFSPALDRDRRVGLSRYQGLQVRQCLMDLGFVHPHRLSTGRRAGQVLLLELTAAGARHLKGAGYEGAARAYRDYLRAFYVDQLSQLAILTWPAATVSQAPAARSEHPPPDLTVLVGAGEDPGDARSVAFRIVTGSTLDIGALTADLKSNDEVWLWAETHPAANQLERLVDEQLPAGEAARVTCAPVASCLAALARGESASAPPAKQRPQKYSSPRQPPLRRQILRAYEHLHDLDWLQESPLVDLAAVQRRRNRTSAMADGWALRDLLIEAATRAARDAGEIPTLTRLRRFLEQYLEGKPITEIAADLGVSREWCSRAYRKQALNLAIRHCELLLRAA